ncbi:histidine phosphatase family protein [Actinomadura madurae]|uniref:histidine phosphatase family protein n=1 Tax=Actinomadura madurae TaxID=1993 RepID=UPI002026A2B3|nr:histidine phosphatase family protein [Actinomadura madurae]MCP9949453.1 histidine phosphatase family protein [Actinomadura madurae]MCP9978697.1 histidine phosphatase family protein [Actinomadura madurae]MCQ0009780.1 histidine phosphatase family protein [Actinomadura madurae]MCQ0014895.1 histidine phosphatase family protein [Actinomadura madurae]URM94996.1 histidine phosphatase family protein [Actinomadura madurae]
MDERDEPNEYRQTRYEAPQGATDVLLIRHGASAPAHPDRPFPLVNGQGDPELAPEGREQAERVAERLAGEDLDALYVTPLRRTEETAAPLARRLGLRPKVETGLREVHLGEWEGGLFRKMVAENDPVAQRMFAEERWDVIPGAEDSEAFAARVEESLTRLAAAHAGGRIAVFTHGGVIAQALASATGARPFAFLAPDNGSISRLVRLGGLASIRGFNDVSHLDWSAPAPLT